ncbi:MAG: hypothetical protein AB1899_05325 [Pseudomonadota bacterium]
MSDIATETRRRFEELLVFNVCDNSGGWLDGLPCFKPDGVGGYLWALPSTWTDTDFDIAWEMGLAFLRARRFLGGAVFPGQLDPAPLELAMVEAAMKRPIHRRQGVVGISDGYRDGFLSCIGAFLDHAINAPHTLPVLLARLEALDDAALRERCLAALDGRPVSDFFQCEGLGWDA